MALLNTVLRPPQSSLYTVLRMPLSYISLPASIIAGGLLILLSPYSSAHSFVSFQFIESLTNAADILVFEICCVLLNLDYVLGCCPNSLLALLSFKCLSLQVMLLQFCVVYLPLTLSCLTFFRMVRKGKALVKATTPATTGSTTGNASLPLNDTYFDTVCQNNAGKLVGQGIVCERPLKFPDAIPDLVRHKIEKQGWNFLYNDTILVNTTLVKEFFANFAQLK
ncbi:hypothetical protein PIB30_093825 [Stylosanthes scabra]|uniref:Uncharacterized protein n=1 Tax=Stylosanthes scabra TaxID=79078 RepID=A0ABU6VTS0_9FABA|nr:hypothetical protein [Stylosanthes scabra]